MLYIVNQAQIVKGSKVQNFPPRCRSSALHVRHNKLVQVCSQKPRSEYWTSTEQQDYHFFTDNIKWQNKCIIAASIVLFPYKNNLGNHPSRLCFH